MAVSAFFYGNAITSFTQAKVNFPTDAIKVMLCTSTYTPNQDTHAFKSDITNEVSGTGYTATGTALGSAAVTYTGATNVLALTGANVSWTSSTITARYAIVYDSTPATDATRPLICYIDFGADVVSSSGTFSINWAGGGIATITVS